MRSLPVVLAALSWASSPAVAQHEVPSELGAEDLESLRAQREWLIPPWMRFQVDARGELLVSPSPHGGQGPAPVFGDVAGLGRSVVNVGAAGFLGLWLMGPRDLASCGDPALHLQLRSVPLDTASLRRRIAAPAEAAEAAEAAGPAAEGAADPSAEPARVELLDRILAVRVLQQRKAEAARPELRALVEDAGTDPFLRRAAADALAALDGVVPESSKPESGKPESGKPESSKSANDEAQRDKSATDAAQPRELPGDVPRELPAGADIIAFADHRRVPAPTFLASLGARAARAMSLRHFAALAGEHGRVPSATVAGAITFSLGPVLVPYELARRYGNVRPDWTLLAMHAPRGGAFGCLLHLHGLVERERFAAGLARDGWQVRSRDGESVAITADGDGVIVLRADHLQLAVPAIGDESKADVRLADFPPEVRACPAWAVLPAGSQVIAACNEALGGEDLVSAAVGLRFDGGLRLEVVTVQRRAEAAAAVVAALGAVRDRVVQRFTTTAERAPAAAAAALRRLAATLASAEPRADGARTLTSVSFADWQVRELTALADYFAAQRD